MDTRTPETKTIPRKNTSLNVREDLWADLRVKAIRSGMTVTEAFEAAITEWVKQEAA